MNMNIIKLQSVETPAGVLSVGDTFATKMDSVMRNVIGIETDQYGATRIIINKGGKSAWPHFVTVIELDGVAKAKVARDAKVLVPSLVPVVWGEVGVEYTVDFMSGKPMPRNVVCSTTHEVRIFSTHHGLYAEYTIGREVKKVDLSKFTTEVVLRRKWDGCATQAVPVWDEAQAYITGRIATGSLVVNPK